MRIAILSDIHANLEAFEACLGDAEQRQAHRFVFLGDLVGCGADPKACLDIVQRATGKGAIVVRGNHDEPVVRSDFISNEGAQVAIEWTRAVLSADQSRYLASLPSSLTEDGRLYVHASAAQPAKFPYVQSLSVTHGSLVATDAPITFAGHVHVPAL